MKLFPRDETNKRVMGRSGLFIRVRPVSVKQDGFLLRFVMTVHAEIERKIPDLVGVGAKQSLTNVYGKSNQTRQKCQCYPW
jgi:hypothetical protein